MAASWEALWKSVYFSGSQPVLTPCLPGRLWRSWGQRWPRVRTLPSSFVALCLLINNSCNWRWVWGRDLKEVRVLLSRVNLGRRQYFRWKEMDIFKNTFLPTMKTLWVLLPKCVRREPGLRCPEVWRAVTSHWRGSMLTAERCFGWSPVGRSLRAAACFLKPTENVPFML